MNAEITEDGVLHVKPTDSIEAYALKQWVSDDKNKGSKNQVIHTTMGENTVKGFSGGSEK